MRHLPGFVGAQASLSCLWAKELHPGDFAADTNAVALTPTAYFRVSQFTSRACFWTVRGSQRTWREATQTQAEHATSLL